MRKRKNYRFIFEALLIFISVLGAVWAENYREFLNEKQEYLDNLLILRTEIHENIGNFRSSYDSIILRNRKISGRLPYLIEQDTVTQFLINTLSDNEAKNDLQAIRITMTLTPWVDWRSSSSIVNWIRSHPEFLITDSLYQVVDSYERLMSYEFAAYNVWNGGIETIREAITEECDIIKLNTENLTMAHPTKNLLRKVRNTIYDLHETNQYMIQTDQLFAKQLSDKLIKIDLALAKRGIDTKSLDSTNLLKD